MNIYSSAKSVFCLILICNLVLFDADAATTKDTFELDPEKQNIQVAEDEFLQIMSINNGIYPDSDVFPSFSKRMHGPEGTYPADVKVQPIEWDVVPVEFRDDVVPGLFDEWSFSSLNPARARNFHDVFFNPYRESQGRTEIMVSFTIEIDWEQKDELSATTLAKNDEEIERPENSVLSEGDWYKIGVTESGMHKIDSDYLSSIGLSASPEEVRVYGHGGRMLPEEVGASRVFDLEEIPSYYDASGDQLVFYGEGPVTWNYDQSNELFLQEHHLYSDMIYYFITADKGSPTAPESVNITADADKEITTYDSRDFHEVNEFNEIKEELKSGRKWFGETFDRETTKNFDFYLPNLNTSERVRIAAEVGARSRDSSAFEFSYGNSHLFNIPIRSVTGNTDHAFLHTGNEMSSSFTPNSGDIDIEVNYIKSLSNSKGWLNYITLNGRSALQYHGGQFYFRDATSVEEDVIGNFKIDGYRSGMKVWDISDVNNVREPALSNANGDAVFKDDLSELREYVAFRPSEVSRSPHKIGKVGNQNLHAEEPVDYLMVVHPDFMDAAKELKAYHEKSRGLSVRLTEPQKIYNEFSSGAQDPSAIRDYARLLNMKGEKQGSPLRYLLLFGDGSYDPKDRVPDNQNYIVTYQTENSNDPVSSYVTDDFFGFLDEGEGVNLRQNHELNIAIGRLPVRTSGEASDVVDKITGYHDKSNFGPWRSRISLMADDGDSGTHLNQSEQVVNTIQKNHPEFNQNKIYLDAYEMEGTPSGPRYPGAKDDFTRAINEGSLVINYLGHGGEIGLTDEEVFRVEDIDDWENEGKLSVFVTGTCDLGRFDDPQRRSAAELMMLKPNAGAISMLTTTRVVYASQNTEFVKTIFDDKLLRNDSGKTLSMGTAFKKAKNEYGFTDNSLKFMILGDPALKVAVPDQKATAIKINDKEIEQQQDTVRALELVTVKGEIHDQYGMRMSDFNGKLHATVFDKPMEIQTLGNKESNPRQNYKEFNSAIFRGQATIEEGEFRFSFVVPQDIDYRIDKGRMSFYAWSENTDAIGYEEGFLVGGTSENPVSENPGPPEIDLYINDTSFEDGDYVDEDAWLIADVEDELGINMTGAGVGHDITGILKYSNEEDMYILNNYYQTELDDHRKGQVRYQMSSLEEGRHDLELKVWNVANKSATARTHFIVGSSEEVLLREVFNYPNPFADFTRFSIQHNRHGDDLKVSVRLYDMQGTNVRNFTADVSNAPNTIEDVKWEAKNENGADIAPGVYIYRVTLEDENGRKAEETGRAIFRP